MIFTGCRFLAKFLEDPTLQGGVVSISLSLVHQKLKLCKEDLLVNIFESMEEIFNIYIQSKAMADFYNL